MPKPISSGLLKATLAQALYLPERKVDYPHRVVQEHDLVSKGKRGRGGAGVTPRDAAVTFTAIANSFIGDEIIKGVRAFSEMPIGHTAFAIYTHQPDDAPGHLSSPDGWKEVEGGPWQMNGFQLPQLQSLPKGHTFIDALTAIIDAARDDAFNAALSKITKEPGQSHKIDVRFGGPEPFAAIEIDMSVNGRQYREEAQYFFDERQSTVAQASAFAVSVQIDHQPLYAVAKLFREDRA